MGLGNDILHRVTLGMEMSQTFTLETFGATVKTKICPEGPRKVDSAYESILRVHAPKSRTYRLLVVPTRVSVVKVCIH